jgi:hypothetical protein
MARSKMGWAVVEKGNRIQIETIESTKTRVRDNHYTIMDEDTGAKIKRVRVTVMN